MSSFRISVLKMVHASFLQIKLMKMVETTGWVRFPNNNAYAMRFDTKKESTVNKYNESNGLPTSDVLPTTTDGLEGQEVRFYPIFQARAQASRS